MKYLYVSCAYLTLAIVAIELGRPSLAHGLLFPALLLQLGMLIEDLIT